MDIINENSREPSEVDDSTRHQFMKDMGQIRYLIGQSWNSFHQIENYQNPRKLKNALYRISDAVEGLEKYDRVPGLWKNNPSAELRMINNASFGQFMGAGLSQLEQAVDKKDINPLARALGVLEDTLLQYTNSVNKSMGNDEVYKNFINYKEWAASQPRGGRQAY